LKAKHVEAVANREYLKILYWAATESECAVEWGLRQLLGSGETISVEAVKIKMGVDQQQAIVDQVRLAEVALAPYDDLLEWGRAEVANG
jgi:hypothetical protein